MSIRTLLVVAGFTLALSCQSIVLAGAPAVDGKDYLLSESELRAVLSVARARLEQLRRWSSISRVHVVTSTKIVTYYRVGNSDEEAPPYFVLHRTNGRWYITSEMDQAGFDPVVE